MAICKCVYPGNNTFGISPIALVKSVLTCVFKSITTSLNTSLHPLVPGRYESAVVFFFSCIAFTVSKYSIFECTSSNESSISKLSAATSAMISFKAATNSSGRG
jgi:hypothetical protein